MWWKQLKEKVVTVPLISASAGDCVEMGYYGMKILWTVLDKKEKSFLLVTKYAIDSLPYNKKMVKTTWETSSLRKWLNSYFFSVVFSKDEAKMILETEVLADNNPEYSHPNFKNDPGNNTKDMLFDMYPLYWTTPAKGVHLCDTVTSSNETLSIYIGKASGRKRRKESNRETFISKCVYGLE